MRKQENEVRKIFVKIRMNAAEVEQLKKQQQKSTESSISNYVRKVALQQPVTIKYRNQSADDFLKEMLLLKKELNAIGNNFNQAVHKLHLLEKIPEFRFWVAHYEGLQQAVVNKIDDIKLQVAKIYEQWSQK